MDSLPHRSGELHGLAFEDQAHLDLLSLRSFQSTSPYKGGTFKLLVTFPPEYPFKGTSSAFHQFSPIPADLSSVFSTAQHPPFVLADLLAARAIRTTLTFARSQIKFQTKIYHPNVDDEGNICVGLLKADAWKPAVKMSQGGLVFVSFCFLTTAEASLPCYLGRQS